jgi:nitrate/TMAO reductase-like tetraheme cytochrome c subunit
MTTEPAAPGERTPLLKNWISLAGVVIVIGSLFSALLLFILDSIARSANPYLGILTYLVAPAFLFFGLFLTVLGAVRQRRKLGRAGAWIPRMVVDLSRPRDRKVMAGFLTASVVFLLVSAIGSYHTYHFTESVTFCGQACHTVMEPELTSYHLGSHARVACVECHIGPGATWFVKSKLSGTYQVYATALKKYPTPIPTPIKNLRPAQETCEQCHWPQKFVGNLERTITYYLADETNSPFTVRMLMKVGGADQRQGPVGGIHWHMNVGNKVQYIATDGGRQKIPYVRTTDLKGKVAEYRLPNYTNAVDETALRTMDCMDCHNRPAHVFKSPNASVDMAISLGRIDPGLPYIKTNAVYALTLEYQTAAEAVEKISVLLKDRYASVGGEQARRLESTIAAVQKIYRENFFPEMKADWRAYPNNIGHMEWPGCFRCHDGQHTTAAGKTIEASNCNACHTILAQGAGAELEQWSPLGQKFKHPGDEVDGACSDCHNGGL